MAEHHPLCTERQHGSRRLKGLPPKSCGVCAALHLNTQITRVATLEEVAGRVENLPCAPSDIEAYDNVEDLLDEMLNRRTAKQTCPTCGYPLRIKRLTENGGIECSSPECDYSRPPTER